MKLISTKDISILIILLFGFSVFAQKERKTKNDTLRTESVTVIKTYNPTINDAFKIETKPANDQKETKPKEVSRFMIKSVPVASTFVPKKAKSLVAKRERIVLPPQNYASLAGGNFGNAEAEVFVRYPAGRDASFSALLEHQSSQGGINEVRLDDFYYDTGLQLNYQKEDKRKHWGLNFEGQHQLYNWYGISENLNITPVELNTIDPSHSFIDINLGGFLAVERSILKDVNTQLRFFFDDYNSSEINFTVAPKLNFEVNNYNLDLPFEVDFLNGSFENKVLNTKLDYQIINLGVRPSVDLSYNNIDFKLGVSGFVSADTQNSKTDFFVYPNLLATYRLLDTGISFYGGLTGGLTQNTYHNASSENVFVAPLLVLTPTSEQFNAFAGIQGSLSSEVSYELKGSFNKENDKPLFQKNNLLNIGLTEPLDYGYGNSFNYVYADINTATISGNLSYSAMDKYDISLTANLYAYDVKGSLEAWNLPQFTTTIRGNYTVNKKLDFNAGIFVIGTRKAFDSLANSVVDLDTIFDVNIGARYKITENWQAFIKGNNVTNQSYERWLDYPVQSAQGLVGVRYLFK